MNALLPASPRAIFSCLALLFHAHTHTATATATVTATPHHYTNFTSPPRFANTTALFSPVNGTGAAYATACVSAHSSYDAALSSWNALHDTVSTTTALLGGVFREPVIFYENATTLCDGHPRVLSSPAVSLSETWRNITLPVTTTIVTETRGLYFSQPSPSCTIAPSDCDGLWKDYSKSTAAAAAMTPAPAIQTPPCLNQSIANASDNGCGVCTIYGEGVELVYFPVPTTVSRDMCATTPSASLTTYGTGAVLTAYAGKNYGANNSAPANDLKIAVVDGHTFTSGTAYISISKVYAMDRCMSTYGTVVSDAILAMPSESVLSLRYSQNHHQRLMKTDKIAGYPVSYADFNAPIPWSAWIGQNDCLNEHDINRCGLIYEHSFRPQLAIPPEITSLSPDFAGCQMWYNGLWDPPLALTEAQSAAPPTLPAGFVPKTTVPAAQPSQTRLAPTSQPTALPHDRPSAPKQADGNNSPASPNAGKSNPPSNGPNKAPPNEHPSAPKQEDGNHSPASPNAGKSNPPSDGPTKASPNEHPSAPKQADGNHSPASPNAGKSNPPSNGPTKAPPNEHPSAPKQADGDNGPASPNAGKSNPPTDGPTKASPNEHPSAPKQADGGNGPASPNAGKPNPPSDAPNTAAADDAETVGGKAPSVPSYRGGNAGGESPNTSNGLGHSHPNDGGRHGFENESNDGGRDMDNDSTDGGRDMENESNGGTNSNPSNHPKSSYVPAAEPWTKEVTIGGSTYVAQADDHKAVFGTVTCVADGPAQTFSDGTVCSYGSGGLVLDVKTTALFHALATMTPAGPLTNGVDTVTFTFGDGVETAVQKQDDGRIVLNETITLVPGGEATTLPDGSYVRVTPDGNGLIRGYVSTLDVEPLATGDANSVSGAIRSGIGYNDDDESSSSSGVNPPTTTGKDGASITNAATAWSSFDALNCVAVITVLLTVLVV